MSLIAELKRRNVIRMAGLYLVGAWLITQVAGTVLPMFGAPDWLPRSVVILLAIGFVPALIFSWVFELTPHGFKRDAEVPLEQSIAPQTARRLDRLIIAVLLIALTYFGFDRLVLAPRREAASVEVLMSKVKAAATADAHSIAVLPFVNMSGDAKNDYFSDGITEEILDALAQIPGLKVAARTSAFAFKGKGEDLRKVGETLGVANVLEGSVQSAGEDVRITAQLIDAGSGFHVWSEKYDRKLTSVFAVEDEISRAIADKLRTQWKSEQPLVRLGTKDAQAHALYLQGIAAIAKRGEALKQAMMLLGEATKRDPDYAAAWAQLSQVYELLPWYELEGWQPALEKAEHAARRALALDAQSAEGHAALANVLRNRFEFVEADREYRRSLELNPGNSEVHNQYGQQLDAVGQFEAAVEHERIAASQDPLAPNPRYMLGILLESVRLQQEAMRMFEQAIAIAPGFLYSYDQLAFSRLYAGDHAGAQADARVAATQTGEDARLAVALMEAVADPARRAQILPVISSITRVGHTNLSGLARAFWYVQLGAPEQALTELEQWSATAEQGERFNGLRFLWMPPFDPLRENVRFKALLKQFGMPDLGVAALEGAGRKIPASGGSSTP